jgi:hypothetical protein
MPSPILEQTYHHPSATPTPSNPEFRNTAAHSGHFCCGQSFHSEADFKAHFADKHDPKSEHYVKPEDHNKKAEPEDPNAWRAVTLADRGIEPLVATPDVPKESKSGPKPFGE